MFFSSGSRLSNPGIIHSILVKFQLISFSVLTVIFVQSAVNIFLEPKNPFRTHQTNCTFIPIWWNHITYKLLRSGVHPNPLIPLMRYSASRALDHIRSSWFFLSWEFPPRYHNSDPVCSLRISCFDPKVGLDEIVIKIRKKIIDQAGLGGKKMDGPAVKGLTGSECSKGNWRLVPCIPMMLWRQGRIDVRFFELGWSNDSLLEYCSQLHVRFSHVQHLFVMRLILCDIQWGRILSDDYFVFYHL